MRRYTPLLIIALSLMTGCTQPVWLKDGATAQQFEADKFDCEQRVLTMYGGYANMGAGHALAAREDIKRCIMAKGYRIATHDELHQMHQ